MKKIIFLLVATMVLVCGCGNKQGDSTALEKGDIPTEKVIITDGKITSGWSAWSRFYAETTGAKASEYSTVDSVIEIEYLYNEALKDGIESTNYEIELRFEDEKYIYKNLTEGIYKTYEYLIETTGTAKGTNKKVRGYFLVNDNTLTYEDIEWSALSSQSTDWVDNVMIYMETIE